MESLKKEYEEWMLSSDVCSDTDEQVLECEANAANNIDEEVKRLEEVMTEKGIDGVREELSTDLDKWKRIGLHIAVTGSSGAGKSSFINALRDVCADDETGAEVGVTETTKDLTPYKHPKNQNFIVWDMPGVGTPNFPKDEYLTSVKFDRYDFFMILSKGRFTEEDLWLAKQIQERNKRFYFIRTNIDIDIYSDSRANRKSHSAENVIIKIQQDCYKNLVDAGIKDPLVFLVDNLDRQKYEFGQVEIQLLQDADSLKMEAVALSLSTLTKEVLQKKRDVLEGRIAEKAMEIACLFDAEHQQRLIFEDEMSTYKEQFNLNEETLRKNKDVLSLSDKNIREFQTFFKDLSEKTVDQLCTKLFLLFGRRGSFIRTFHRILYIYRQISILLPYVYKSLSRVDTKAMFQFSCFALHQNLEEMFTMALNVYGLNTQKGFVKSVMQS